MFVLLVKKRRLGVMLGINNFGFIGMLAEISKYRSGSCSGMLLR